MKNKEGAFLGIGFWAGMGAMSLINFCGSIFLDRNYYTMRYAIVMFFISLILMAVGIIYLKNINKKNK